MPSIELANFDGIVCWSYPLRYSGMNLPGAFTLPFCTPPHAYPPFSMQWWCVDAVVVITGGWCVAKKKVHTEDTTSGAPRNHTNVPPVDAHV